MALIANDLEWSARALQNILIPQGYGVIRASSPEEARERLTGNGVDAAFIDAGLAGGRGIEFCRSIHADPRVTDSTPLLVTTVGATGRQDRVSALRAGAWEVFGFPLDAEELLLKLAAYIRAKQESDSARDDGLVDGLTGLYNFQGVMRRTQELASQAYRHHRPLACVVIALVDSGSTEGGGSTIGRRDDGGATALSPAVDRIAGVFREKGRVSDVIGRQNRNEFVVVAPDTDSNGAEALIRRMGEAIRSAAVETDDLPEVQVRIGSYAVSDFGEASIEPVELLTRATKQLRVPGLARHSSN